MGRTQDNIEQTVHTTGSGLLNEFGTQLANEITPYLKDAVQNSASSVIIDHDATLAKTPDATETSDTTTAVYQVGDYVYNSTSGILYECILVNTIGILLTNATYFTAVTSNTLAYTYLNSIYTDGKSNGGYQLSNDQLLNGTIDFSTASDGVNWVAKEKGLNSFIFSTLRPTIGRVIPDGVDNPSTTDAVPTMTSATTPSGTVTSTTVLINQAYFAFDDTTSNTFLNVAFPVNLGYGFVSPKVINKYTLQVNDTPSTRSPKSWTVQGSNDTTDGQDGTWDILDTVINETSWTTATKTFTFANDVSYSHYRIVVTDNNGDGTYTVISGFELIEYQGVSPYLNTSDYKWYKGDDTPYTNPISWFREAYQAASGTPQTKRTDIELLPEVVSDGAVFTGFVELQENRKVLDIGTIFNNNRYVINNPFGNENYMDCDVKVQLFFNNKWFSVGSGQSSGGADRGLIVDSLAEGIVIQTATTNLVYSSSQIVPLDTYGNTGSVINNAPARVIVTYNGKAK